MIEWQAYESLDRLATMLSADVIGQKTSHAYVFYGNEGTGKKTMAKWFAKLLLCQHPTEQGACGVCENCLLNQSGTHPDLYFFDAQGKKSIAVEQVRAMIQDVYVKPFTAQKKVYLVSQADRMTPAAQNALLKVLEEPPLYAVFVLLCDQEANLLDTVLSRTVKIHFPGATDEEISAMLLREFPEADRRAIVASAGGSIGYAKHLAQDGHVISLQKEAASQLEQVILQGEKSLFGAVRFLDKQKEDASFILNFWSMLLRDVLLLKTNRASYLTYISYRDVSMKLAERLSLKAIVSMIESLHVSQKMLVRYINVKEVAYRLLLQIEEDRHE